MLALCTVAESFQGSGNQMMASPAAVQVVLLILLGPRFYHLDTMQLIISSTLIDVECMIRDDLP